jgi:hypothetical protein
MNVFDKCDVRISYIQMHSYSNYYIRYLQINFYYIIILYNILYNQIYIINYIYIYKYRRTGERFCSSNYENVITNKFLVNISKYL